MGTTIAMRKASSLLSEVLCRERRMSTVVIRTCAGTSSVAEYRRAGAAARLGASGGAGSCQTGDRYGTVRERARRRGARQILTAQGPMIEALPWWASEVRENRGGANEMESAIFGLIGVVAGAVIATGSEYMLTRRRERREVEGEKAGREAARRLASRLIDEELQVADAAVEFCRLYRKWWPTTKRLSTDAWEQGKAILATEYGYEEWQTVMIAMIAVTMLDGTYQQYVAAGLKDHEISDNAMAELDQWSDAIGAARQALIADVGRPANG
jgi:hypothetical protein